MQDILKGDRPSALIVYEWEKIVISFHHEQSNTIQMKKSYSAETELVFIKINIMCHRTWYKEKLTQEKQLFLSHNKI